MLSLDELKAITTKIAQNLDNQALVTELLTTVNDSLEETYTLNDTLSTQTKEFENKIDQLQKTNMNLFLKIGQPTPDEAQDKLGGSEQLTFDDLLKDFEGSV